MKTTLRFILGSALLLLCGSAFAAGGKDAKQAKVELDRFRLIPVLEGSRIVPLDTFARTQMLSLRGRPIPGEEPVSWLARTLFDPASTDDDVLLKLDHPDIAADASITNRPDHSRYKYSDVVHAVPHLVGRARDAEEVDNELRTEIEKETIRFTRAILQFEGLRRVLLFARPPDAPFEDMFRVDDPVLANKLGIKAGDNPSYYQLFNNPALEQIGMDLLARASKPDTVLDENDRAAMALIGELQRFQERFLGFRFPMEVIPVDPHSGSQSWQSPPNVLNLARSMQGQDPELMNDLGNWAAMTEAYQAGDQAAFDAAVDQHLSFIERRTELAKTINGASETWEQRATSIRRLDLAYLLIGSMFILLIAFGKRIGTWIGSTGLLIMFGASLLLLGVRLYSGTTLSVTGQWTLGLSLLATFAVGAWLSFGIKQPFWRLIGKGIMGLMVFTGVAILLIAKSVNPETGEAWTVAGSWLLPIESSFNQADWFGQALKYHLITFLISFVAILVRKPIIIKIALVVAGIALLYHVAGIEYRMFITQRPPVTNLYATFPFVAFICVLLGIGIEGFYKNGIGVMCGSIVGWALIMMSGIFAKSDTMNEVVPVLSSQFWLSTHVITIMFGYAGVFLAGVVGHVWLLSRLITGLKTGGKKMSKGDKNFLKVGYRIMMSILAFGLIFSFLGTMLGGVWADQSWGRFWGWDPKENGAILIVIWCAIMFHARMGNMLRETGVSAMAVGGCVVVMIAWLGINNLGVGLHSYGFQSGLARGLIIYMVAEAVFLLVTVPIVMRMEAKGRPKIEPVPAPAS